ncbi:class I SAM-dependent methyltransferase, partial [Bradyrhizobium sp. PRIMUS42]|uniref:class I SAM-dependent methyltransferase n=1 Tax=Bradyrhizobium sp. PRIMUS42 TaxID=2908926 RepID=UPI001FF28396
MRDRGQQRGAQALGFDGALDAVHILDQQHALDRLYDLFSFKVIPPLGRMITGDAESYQYLVESIRK